MQQEPRKIRKKREVGKKNRFSKNNKTTIDQKIDMLIEWLKKYPKVEMGPTIPERILREYCGSEEEYRKLITEYNMMEGHYTYIRSRYVVHKLSNEQILKCKEGNVRGVFGYSTQVEELARKSGQKEKEIYYIITKFGTMDNFKSIYREGKLGTKDLELAQKFFRKFIDVDLNPNNKNYERLYMKLYEIYMKNFPEEIQSNNCIIGLYSGNALKKALESFGLKKKKMVEKALGLREGTDPEGFKAAGDEVGVTRERSRQIVGSVLKKLTNKLSEFRIEFAEGMLQSEEIETDINEIYKLLTEEERKMCSELLDKIFSSDIIYLEGSYQVTKDDEEVLRGIEFIRNRPETIKEREKTKKQEKYYTELENANISVNAYNFLKELGIEIIGDVSKLSKKDELKLIREIGRDEYLQLFLEISKFCDIEEKIETIKNSTQEKVEDKLEKEAIEEEIAIQELLEKKDRNFSLVTIDKLNLSKRAYKCLEKAGIHTLEELSKLTIEELMYIQELGKKTANEIITEIGEYGITLRHKKELLAEEDEKQATEKNLIEQELLEQTDIDFSKITIDKLNLSQRAYNCLRRSKKNTLMDLSKLTIEELVSIRNMGTSSVIEVIKKIERYGIILKTKDELSENSESIILQQEMDKQSNEEDFLVIVTELAKDKRKVREKNDRAKKLEQKYVEEFGKYQEKARVCNDI